jgi:hypothetical protein
MFLLVVELARAVVLHLNLIRNHGQNLPGRNVNLDYTVSSAFLRTFAGISLVFRSYHVTMLPNKRSTAILLL